MMPWQQTRNVHAVSGGGDIAEDKNGFMLQKCGFIRDMVDSSPGFLPLFVLF